MSEKTGIVVHAMQDRTLDLFESQYPVPAGVSYNSYVIRDEKTAVLDTVDKRAGEQWLEALEQEFPDGKGPDYLVILHMEPDHSANIKRLAEKYPSMKLVGNAKTFAMISQFFDLDLEGRKEVVAEGGELNLGRHTLRFHLAPMVHWPEVMVAYETEEKALFSADAFGTFGCWENREEAAKPENWTDEARRYYLNIVGKYGMQVQTLLKKLSGLEINTIYPLHGPALTGDIKEYLAKYDIWSSYRPEEDGILVAYASIHGHTAQAAEKLAELLRGRGANVKTVDLTRTDVSYALADAFRYPKMVLASSTYDAAVFPAMEHLLTHLKAKNFQKRTVGLMENGSWAPAAAKQMRAALEAMKEITIAEPVVSIKSAMNDSTIAQMEKLADAMTE